MSTLLTSQIITKESILQVSNNLVLGTRVDWSYGEMFQKTSGKIGQTLDIRRPILAAVALNNLAYSSNATTALIETSVPLQVASTLTSSFTFSEQERRFRVEDFSKRYLKNICSTIAARFDQSLHDACSNAGANFYALGAVPLGNMTTKPQFSGVAGWVVGTAATPLTRDIVQSAVTILNEAACPDDGDRYGVLTPKANGELALANITLFNAQKAVSEIYAKGRLGEFLGVEWAWSNSTATHVNGTQGSLVVSAGDQSEWSDTGTLTVTALAGAVKAGDAFVSTVKMVNPYTKVATSVYQQFTATKDAAIGATEVIVSPAPISSGPYQNISAGISGTTLTLIGATGSVNQESILLHKSAIAVASPELEAPTGGKGVLDAHFESDDELGLGIRFISQYDGLGAAPGANGVPGWANRMDLIFGTRIVRGEWIVRIRS